MEKALLNFTLRNKSVRCAVCGSKDTSLFLSLHEHILLKCASCGLVFLDKPAADSSSKDLYPEGYYEKTGAALKNAEKAFMSVLAFFEKRKIKRVVRGGRFLDIGCGDGSFLERLKGDKDIELYGIEVSAVGFNKAVKRKGIKIFNSTLLECNFNERFFDVITLRHVLEHIDNPKELLLEIFRIMKHGGILIIRVPNIDSVEAGLAGEDWFHLDIPRHLFHYSPKSLSMLLEKCGFKDIKINHFSLEYKHVILYSILDWVGCKADMFRKIALIFIPFAVGLSYILALIKKSGTIEIYARK